MKTPDPMGRVWKSRPELLWNEGPGIGWSTYLVKHNDFEINKPMLIAGRYFVFKLIDWKFEIDHTWYDGPNCSWWFGPLLFSSHGHGMCEKCAEGTKS